MSWSEHDSGQVNQMIQGDDNSTNDFDDIANSSFHRDSSLFMDASGPSSIGFSDIADSSFQDIENISLDDDLLAVLDHLGNQVGAGRDDYNIKLINEKSLKDMKAVEVNYQLTFNDKFFREKKKMKEVKDILKDAFEKMINHVKKDLRPGDIMRAAIYNESLDLPIYVPCRPMEEMDVEAMLESLVNVLNSNEDIPFDSTCHINIGAIKYPRGGRGEKKAYIDEAISIKKSIVQIKNSDNLCLVRAVLVAFSSACKTSIDEYRKIKDAHPTLSPADILIQFEKCPPWYWKHIRDNTQKKQDNLTNVVSHSMGLSENQSLSYAFIPRLEDLLNVNIYVVSSTLGNAFSYISQNHDQERKKIFLYHVEKESGEHFHAIVKIGGFFAHSNFCSSCLKPYEHQHRHHCKNHCRVCLSDNCKFQQSHVCQDCHRTCRSIECYERHKSRTENGTVPCDLIYQCPTCHKSVERWEMKPEDHKCGHFTCKSCRQYVVPEHFCYARSHPPSDDKERRYIFADIEASQKDEIVQCEWGYASRLDENCEQCKTEDKPCSDCRTCQHCFRSHCGKSRHSLVLAVCQSACEKCENDEVTPDSTCKFCGDRCANCSRKDKKTKRYITPPCPGKC